ncbi:hypothetical protein PAHAL_7G178500 [Panicum hallii]|uniref:Uncharacterized protein n=1 Tax=Panicum hallii TaxID=206008 RepID=A0A2T8ICN2_9POAL|nr:hypothetical protein PAHAL_7G178500 [Panicum hallii]
MLERPYQHWLRHHAPSGKEGTSATEGIMHPLERREHWPQKLSRQVSCHQASLV